MKTTYKKTTFYFNLGTKYSIIFYLVTSDLSQRNYKSSERIRALLPNLPPPLPPVKKCLFNTLFFYFQGFP